MDNFFWRWKWLYCDYWNCL